jgi:LPS export ABC transporter protein LptC
MKRTINFFLIVGLCIVTETLGCSKSEVPKADLIFSGKDFPMQEGWGVRVAFSDSGIVRALLKTATVQQFDKDGTSIRKMNGGVMVDFFSTEGKHTSVMTAERAVIYANNDIEAFDHVVITSDDSTVVKTEYMKWTANDKKIRSDKFVTITKPTETLQGYGFESDQDLKNYRIFKASGTAQVKD